METRNCKRAMWAMGALTALAIGLAGCGPSTKTGSSGGMGGDEQPVARGGQVSASAVASPAGMADDGDCDKIVQVTFTEKQAMGKPDQYTFSPATVTIKKGEYISFLNNTDEIHSLVATPDAGLAASAIDKGENQPVQFTHSGKYTVESKNAQHRGSMTVTVTDEAGTTCGMMAPAATVNLVEQMGPPDHYSFSQAMVTLKMGDGLAVVNKTDEDHTLKCAPDPGIDTMMLAVDKGETQVLPFKKAGTFVCVSAEHADAKITVKVG